MNTQKTETKRATARDCVRRFVNSIDCSKDSNKGDLLALAGLGVIAFALSGAVWLAYFERTFEAGFLSATIVWKWRDWIYAPIDKVLNKLWS